MARKLVSNHRLAHCSKSSGAFQGDGAMLVAPASSKKAVTHHAVGKQKKEECQDNYKQELSNPQPHGPSFFSRYRIQIGCHQSRLRNT
jgi:hypothetical protein